MKRIWNLYICSYSEKSSGLDQYLEHRVVKKAIAFVPGHITGLFAIHDDDNDPLLCGSTGAGFSVAAGIKTTVHVTDSPKLKIEVECNNIRDSFPVTKTVIHRLAEEYNQSFEVKVKHSSSIPSGVGYGASGAGALGTALALGHLLDSNMSIEQAANYAHYAEVTNHTGLGDVSAQVLGGFEIRSRPGAFGIGKIRNFEHDEALTVILVGNSGLETRNVITDFKWRSRINEVGKALIEQMIKDPTFENFIECSKQFAESTGLMSKNVKRALDDLDRNGYENASMVMLGNSIFCFCSSSESKDVVNIISDYWNRSEVLITNVTEFGGRLM
jgi:pantoate kinase